VDRDTGIVAAGRGHDINKYEFMNFKDRNPLDIKSFAVMTGWGGTGEWVFQKRQRGTANKRHQAYKRAAWFLGDQGEDCTKVCAGKNRTCDSTIQRGFDYDEMRRYVKENLGVTCDKDTRRWWAHDQPCYVAGGPDGNQNKCLAYSRIPKQVRCSGKHPRVMRWCKCTATTMVPHFYRFRSNDRTWDDINALAKGQGGRLMTLAEARLYLEQKGKVPIYVRHDEWAAVANPAAPGGKDWIQLGKRWPLGRSHKETWGYPGWGNVRRSYSFGRSVVMWVSERKR